MGRASRGWAAAGADLTSVRWPRSSVASTTTKSAAARATKPCTQPSRWLSRQVAQSLAIASGVSAAGKAARVEVFHAERDGVGISVWIAGHHAQQHVAATDMGDDDCWSQLRP